MSIILALDATAEQCSAAILIKGHIITRSQHAPRDHTQMLLSFVDALLKEADISLSQLDAVAFGAGPGSFTGLRIAAAMAQGLAFGAKKPVLPISSLRTVAFEAYERTQATAVLASLDARKSEIYWGLYQWDENSGMKLHGEEHVTAASEVILPNPQTLMVSDILPEAQAVAKLAAFDLKLGLGLPPEQALPTYIRNNVV